MNLIRTVASISSLTLLSRITGLVRENLTAFAFGAGATTDAFMVAFRLPNMLRRLFAEGAFSQAFVPILAHVRATEGDAQAKSLIQHVATALFWALMAITVAGVIGAPLLVKLMAGGFSSQPEVEQLTIAMTRWMFPYVLLIALVSMASGILNTWGEFRIPAFTPVLLNICFIVAALAVAPRLANPIWALVSAVVVGGLAQLTLQIWALQRRSLRPRIRFDFWKSFQQPGVRLTLRKMAPPALAMSVAPISLVINTNIATHQGAGSVSWLNFADRLMEFPTAMLGVALGTVLLPSLSKAHSQGDRDAYSGLLDWGLRLVMLLAVPSAVALALFAQPLIAVMYHYGHFSTTDVVQTANALIGYALGLLGLIAVKVLAPGFFARQDTKTPMYIALTVLVSTQLLNLVTVPRFAHAGLSLSISLAALLNASLLLAGLLQRGLYQPRPGWLAFLLKLTAANAFMGATLVKLSAYFNWFELGSTPLIRIALVGAVILSAVVIYFGSLYALGIRPADFQKIQNESR